MKVQRFDPPRDLRRLLEIERDAFGEHAWPAELFRSYHDDREASLFLVVRVGRVMAGYVIAVHSRADSVEIESLAVHSRFRRRGVASVLFEAVLRRARRLGVNWIGLMVRRDNDAAIRFYRGLGFVRTATVSGYYEDGGAAWRMRLQIP